MKKVKLIIEVSKIMTDEQLQHERDFVDRELGITYEEAVEQTAFTEAVEPFIDYNDEEYKITVEVEDIED